MFHEHRLLKQLINYLNKTYSMHSGSHISKGARGMIRNGHSMQGANIYFAESSR